MNLDDWRSRINNLDKRSSTSSTSAPAALRIGELKRQQDLPYCMSRSARPQVLDRLVAADRGPLPARRDPRDLARDPLRLARARAPAAGRLPRPAGAPSRTRRRVRRFGSSAQLPARAHDRRDLRRGRARPRRVRRGAGGELDRRRGQRHARPADRLRRARSRGELTLDIAQHLLSRAGELGEVKRVLLAPAGARPVPRLARRAPAGGGDRGDAVHRRRRPSGRADDATRGRHRLRDGRRGSTACRSSGARIEDNPAELHALPRHRPPARRAHRARQDLDPLLDEERAGRALQHPGAVRGATGST